MENGGRKHDGSDRDPHQRKIQKLEKIFKECPRPDEKRRHQLSRELGLAPRLIKFWFLNKRIQILKGTQYERSDDGCEVRAESNRVNRATGLGDAQSGCKDPKISKP